MLARNAATRAGSEEYVKPGPTTAFRLSAYTMCRQREPSHDSHVHVVEPGVCPGVKCAVIAS
jgi:hypothetical protein